MRNIILILVLTIFSINVCAMEVWLTTDQPVSQAKMKELLEDLPDEVKNMEVHWIFDHLLRFPLNQETKEKISLLISQAEEESLNGRFTEAIRKYELLLHELDLHPNIFGLQTTRTHIICKTG